MPKSDGFLYPRRATGSTDLDKLLIYMDISMDARCLNGAILVHRDQRHCLDAGMLLSEEVLA